MQDKNARRKNSAWRIDCSQDKVESDPYNWKIDQMSVSSRSREQEKCPNNMTTVDNGASEYGMSDQTWL